MRLAHGEMGTGRCASLLAVGIAACAAVPETPQDPDGTSTNLGLLVGLREFDDDLEPIEEQTSFAFEFDSYRLSAPVGFEVGLAYSSDDESAVDPLIGPFDIEGEFFEIYAGLRKTWGFANDRFHPYLAAGGSLIDANAEIAMGSSSFSDDDSSLGGYVHSGVYYDITDHLHVGIDGRWLFGTDLDFGGLGVEADYLQVALVLGFHLSRPTRDSDEARLERRKRIQELEGMERIDAEWEEAKRDSRP